LYVKKIISAQEYDCRKQDSALELNEYEKAAYDSWKAYGTNSDLLSNLVSRSLNMPVKGINKIKNTLKSKSSRSSFIYGN